MMRRRFLLLLVSLGLFLMGLLCTPISAQGPRIQVSILMYSGVQDPQWPITDPAQIETLRSFMQNIPPTGAPAWPTLGYRGFQLVNTSISGFPQEVRVLNGVIQIFDNDI